MSRYVDIGYIMSFDSKSQLQASAELFKDTLTFNFSRIVDDMTYKEIKDRFVSIAPGTYAVTSIACDYTNKKVWMGADKPTLFSDETGQAVPIKGTNVIEVRAGEILDAGILEIRSDEVGFFETKTASIVSALTPADQQASLRETFRDMSRKLRFATFTQRAGF
ncbi:hypothetical protein AB4072_06240 [Microvirga sp. 2MCAF38]|uniref:hypothetical protein n=1 Tax=Microvirga sp. 2MCAF38 TaxID=3232989 RepID=UPI003F985DCC